MTTVIDRGDLVLRAGPPGGKPIVEDILSLEDNEDPMQKEIGIIQDSSHDDKNQPRVIATVPLQCGVLVPSILCQHYFEVAGAASVCLTQIPFLAAIGSGASSAIVCDFGHCSTRITPVQDGYVHHSSSVTSSEISGVYQNKLLDSTDVTRAKDIHMIKANNAFVPDADYVTNNSTSSYTLPDGNQVELSNYQKASLGEYPFSPNDFLSLRNVLNAAQLVKLAIFSVPEEVHYPQVCNNVLLCGGMSAMKGFYERMNTEFCGTANRNPVKIHCVDDPHLLAWKGGSLLSQLTAVSNISVSRAEYMEHGPNLVHKRCL
ncbi:actin-like protein [Perkinsela sp. CCAP 1560/4]|nr:actin-like protein [Perkinsela sp. CCAP 1560/4]|eukprot:KNH07432.1 actin-like protein [Perkinsela sp. CCAP 1560/4]